MDYELAGARAFWTKTEEPTTVTIMARAGITDETARLHGIAHLAEHLVLSGLHHHTIAFNGSVDLRITTFYAQGTSDEATEFVDHVVGRMASPDIDRLEAETQILTAEDRQRGFSRHDSLLAHLFGAAGPGLSAYPEFALRWVGPEHLSEWSGRAYTTGNVAIAVAGPRPVQSKRALRPGSRMELPSHRQVLRPSGLTRIAPQESGVSLGAVGARSEELFLATEILRARLFDRLRTQLGAVYDVASAYTAFDRDRAFVFYGADCDRGKARAVADAFAETIGGLLVAGPEQLEIDRARSRLMAWTNSAETVARAGTGRRALAHILGDDYIDVASLTTTLAGLTPDIVRDALQQALSSGLAIAPAGTRGFNEPSRPSTASPPGVAYRRKDQGEWWRKPGGIKPFPGDIVVGEQQLSLFADNEWTHVPWNEIAYVVPGNEYRVEVCGLDGSWISVPLQRYRRADELRKTLIQRLPESLDIPMARGDNRTWRRLPSQQLPLGIDPKRS